MTLVALILLFLSTARTTQANDLCTDAISISDGVAVSATTIGATTDAPGDDCSGEATYSTGGIWYSFIAPSTGPYEVSTCQDGTDFDTQLTVFTGSNCNSLSCIAHEDDQSFFLLCSELSFAAQAGQTYYILVHGALEAEGSFELLIRGLNTPSNDLCDGAQPILLNTPQTGTTENAIADTPSDDCSGLAVYDSKGVWFAFTATETDSVKASTCQPGTDFDTQLTVYTGDCSTLSCIAHNDEAESAASCSELTFAAQAGETYSILLHGFDGSNGVYELILEPPPEPTPSPTESKMNAPAPVPGDKPSSGSTTSILSSLLLVSLLSHSIFWP